MKFLNDFNEKWYLLGTIIGILAGITIGWLMFHKEPQPTEIIIESFEVNFSSPKDYPKETGYDYFFNKSNRTCIKKNI